MAVAVEQRLVDLGLDDRPVEATRADLATSLGVSTDAIKRALAALRRTNRLAAETIVAGGHQRYSRPAGYAVLMAARPPSAEPPDPGRIQPPDPPARPRAATPDPRAPDHRSEPSKNSSSSRDGSPTRAHEEPPDPPGGQEPPGVEPPGVGPPGVVEIGQAVVGWAVDEQRRLGKPPLDGALLGKLGSMAKRMSVDVEPTSLKRAAEYLVAHDMTALDAALRKVLAATRPRPGEGTLREEAAELRRLAAESRAHRFSLSPAYHYRPHAEEELIEVWALIAETWPRFDLPIEPVRAAWHEHLRVLPTGCILWALERLAGEDFPPNWGKVWKIGLPELQSMRRTRDMQFAVDLDAAYVEQARLEALRESLEAERLADEAERRRAEWPPS